MQGGGADLTYNKESIGRVIKTKRGYPTSLHCLESSTAMYVILPCNKLCANYRLSVMKSVTQSMR